MTLMEWINDLMDSGHFRYEYAYEGIIVDDNGDLINARADSTGTRSHSTHEIKKYNRTLSIKRKYNDEVLRLNQSFNWAIHISGGATGRKGSDFIIIEPLRKELEYKGDIFLVTHPYIWAKGKFVQNITMDSRCVVEGDKFVLY